MGDGRLTEQGTGKVADFTQSIVVLASNEEFETMLKLQAQIADPDDLTNACRSHLVSTGRWRPEILARIDRIYVFKELPLEVKAEIVAMKCEKLTQAYGVELEHIDAHLLIDMLRKSEKVKDFGIRALVQILERDLAPGILHAAEGGAKRVRLGIDAQLRPTVECVV